MLLPFCHCLFLSPFASSETEHVSHWLWTTRWSRSWELPRSSLELLIQLFTSKHARSVHVKPVLETYANVSTKYYQIRTLSMSYWSRASQTSRWLDYKPHTLLIRSHIMCWNGADSHSSQASCQPASFHKTLINLWIQTRFPTLEEHWQWRRAIVFYISNFKCTF